MIDKVIICGVRRANELLPISEIKQSIGRCGRSYDKSGEGIVLVPSKDETYAWSCFNDITPPITSEMDDIDNISFHLLPFMDQVYDETSYNHWFERTLAFAQGKKTSWNEVLQYLIDNECYKENSITDFGKISINFYFSPKRLILLKNKIQEAVLCGSLEDPYILSWVLSDTHIPLSNVNTLELSEYKNGVKRLGLIFEHGELIQGFAYYCILNNKRPSWLKNVLNTTKDDMERLFRVCILIAEQQQIYVRDVLSEAMIKVIKRVPKEIAKIMYEFNLQHKSCAYELMDMNIISKDDLEDKKDYIMNYGTEILKKELHEKGFLPDLTAFIWKNRKNKSILK